MKKYKYFSFLTNRDGKKIEQQVNINIFEPKTNKRSLMQN